MNTIETNKQKIRHYQIKTKCKVKDGDRKTIDPYS